MKTQEIIVQIILSIFTIPINIEGAHQLKDKDPVIR